VCSSPSRRIRSRCGHGTHTHLRAHEATEGVADSTAAFQLQCDGVRDSRSPAYPQGVGIPISISHVESHVCGIKRRHKDLKNVVKQQ
jgi:hypothetical protein